MCARASASTRSMVAALTSWSDPDSQPMKTAIRPLTIILRACAGLNAMCILSACDSENFSSVSIKRKVFFSE
jgi:hypothetical protein